MRWERVPLPQAQQPEQGREEAGGPGKRWGHTCNAIKGGRFLYVFGGYGRDNCQTNQVHVFDTGGSSSLSSGDSCFPSKFAFFFPGNVFDLDWYALLGAERKIVKQTWSQPTIKGTPPAPRDSHSCTNVGDNLFVFGGTDGMNPLRDLHILDTSSHTWISPSIRGEGPEAREGHSAALVGKKLFIFGGCGKSPDDDEEVYYNDLYILNTETFVWKKAMTTGIPPSARDSHSCSTWKNKMIVIGGEDGRDYYLSDAHILDADTLMWKELNTTGHMLPPRAGHSTVAFGKILFVYGGFTEAQKLYDDLFMLDVESAIWSKVTTASAGPSARFSMAGDCLDPVRSGVLVFVGGCNRSLEALEDMYYLHTGLTREQEPRLEKLSLRKKLKLKCQEQNLTLGQDKALVQVGVTTSTFQPVPLSIYGQPGNVQGKKIFQARVTENLGDRYTIETVIDGKPLRGILFSNKPTTLPIPFSSSSSRKRTYGDSSTGMPNGDYNSESKASRGIQPESIDDGQADDVHGKEASSKEPHSEPPGPVPVSNVTQPSDGSDLEKVPAKQELSLQASINSKDDRMDEAPNLNLEVPKESASPSTKDSDVISQIKDERTSGQDERGERTSGQDERGDLAKSV
ncbi:serine/threonine-protein phosphatase BSU1-like isoform X4 [Rhodamnia argentea]|uniref:Serine/threonine-protein phosphatase BSU1-like isoform X4 n=1 Tax=Rhodamnia argentea TaxID=178133 RepID=A0ABM3HGX6_9MYRT|nr:serine/threonine-protein phosphatase BSU1-like isoform X4 [Rhodamnia argentea]